ncbi:hypothetical protein ONS95_009177 [Cadophora gregata]|uniref:uncharacterized protein n=1 Tax=Cadophora gregata TaxID=51156 RepID=UPI0026DC172C|nr:uncharacterized protein ONS95_009177 [Cadophora gregata]KAK0124196.1 hypothetical protein ONS95_009177 [Cadophora gregata]
MDVLFFEYFRCGSRDKDYDEYLQAMSDAAQILKVHQGKRGVPRVHEIRVSWCNRADFADVLKEYNDIEGLEKATLIAHDHYNQAGASNRCSDDWDSMVAAASDGELAGYSFDTDQFDHTNVNLREEARELDEEIEEWKARKEHKKSPSPTSKKF